MQFGYALVQVSDPQDWETYHRIRREELFSSDDPRGAYDPAHPDEFLPGHHSLLLKWKGEGVATARLDLRSNGLAVVRLVAVAKMEQGKGHGKKLSFLLEQLAMMMGVTKFVLNARPSAIGFYRKEGYVFESWDPEDLKHTSDGCVQMSKAL